jgi:hypothetical protein
MEALRALPSAGPVLVRGRHPLPNLTLGAPVEFRVSSRSFTQQFTQLHTASRSFTQLHTASHSFTQLHTASHSFTQLHTASHRFTQAFCVKHTRGLAALYGGSQAIQPNPHAWQAFAHTRAFRC